MSKTAIRLWGALLGLGTFAFLTIPMLLGVWPDHLHFPV
jgi:hypothetical protein